MSDFGSINYCTIYESVGTVSHSLEPDCCFHTITKDYPEREMDNNYSIWFFQGLNFIHKTCNNNASFFGEKEICQYLNIIKQYVPFDYSLEANNLGRIDNDLFEDLNDEFYIDEDRRNDYDFWELNIHLCGNILQHKFVLKLIRALYEYPFNMYLIDIFRLMKHPLFRRYGVVNLYIFVTHLMYRLGIYCNDDQSLTLLRDEPFKLFPNTECYIKALSNSNLDDDNWQLSKIFTTNYSMTLHNTTYWRDVINNRQYQNASYWQSDEEFNNRLGLYIKHLKYYK